jgi:hypothetical protein
MNRAMRFIFNWLTVVSLLLCVVTVGLWVRSDKIQDSFNWEFTTNTSFYNLELISGDGDLLLKTHREVYLRDQREFMVSFHQNIQRGFFHLIYPYAMPATMGRGRFFLRYRQIGTHTIITSGIPVWCIALFTGILPLAGGSRYVRQRMRYANSFAACVACGYDLRATPSRCPECGTAPQKVKA